MSIRNLRSTSTALVFALLLLAAGCAELRKHAHPAGPWNLAALKQPPAADWGARTGLVQEVYYAGEPLQGKMTRVFGYIGRPAEGAGPFPAMVLVHGGGGKAFREWAEHWAKRGYVALAMDLSGNGPNGRLPDGGPDQSDKSKFREFTDADMRDMWTYHAVAAVVRGHSLLASLPEVDRRRIGITGISWGGYLTCIVAGIDDRLKVAVPVYGCGFLGENSVWKSGSLAALSRESRARWLRFFDPSQYLGGVRCPILFLNGSNDFAYPLDSYRRSYELVRSALRTVSVQINLPHGHIWTFGEVDAFVDSVLGGGAPLPRLQSIKAKGGTVSARITSQVAVSKPELHYTTDTGEWQKRKWTTVPAELNASTISAGPPAARPLVCFLSVTDERGLRVSTPHIELE
ncbi:MAG: alpha/beta fold hydrolase [Verrucomicrobia bacterium]|nr:alpha/beta fold hydrolase [Verrucomicrobiota bacterium]